MKSSRGGGFRSSVAFVPRGAVAAAAGVVAGASVAALGAVRPSRFEALRADCAVGAPVAIGAAVVAVGALGGGSTTVVGGAGSGGGTFVSGLTCTGVVDDVIVVAALGAVGSTALAWPSDVARYATAPPTSSMPAATAPQPSQSGIGLPSR